MKDNYTFKATIEINELPKTESKEQLLYAMKEYLRYLFVDFEEEYHTLYYVFLENCIGISENTALDYDIKDCEIV